MTATSADTSPIQPEGPSDETVAVGDTATADQTRVEEPERSAARNVLLDAGDVVGTDPDCRWTVLRHIADGGFSSVYQVKPAGSETRKRFGPGRRALKCLWGTPAELTQLGGEAGKMAAVDGHDNVLGLVTSLRFEQQGPFSRSHYVGLVLELATEDLYGFRDRLSVPERAWAGVFEQVAAGLEHIHSRRIVHGDIKPTNLLRVGSAFKIADFGLSAQLETTRSAGIGLARTIAFWPPESGNQGVRDEDGVRRPPVDGWRASQMGDVWALAVSIHRVLTGRHITTGASPEHQYELVCAGRYTIDDRLGPGWRSLLSDCLVHDPELRVVTTAGDLRRRLAELALPEEYLSVPWPEGAPRVTALLDVADRTLVQYLTQEGGRVHGVFVRRGEVLLDAAHHVHGAVVPALAQQVRDSQRAAVRLSEEQERLRELAARAGPEDGRTEAAREAERERTRQLSVAVAEVSRQRDQMIRERDQANRRSENLIAERNRLARQHTDLNRRLDRLEQERARAPVAPVVAGPSYPPPVRPSRRRRWSVTKALGCLIWTVILAIVGLVGGLLLASQIAHGDPWEIISSAVEDLLLHIPGN